MVTRLRILSILLSMQLCSKGQFAFPTKAFHNHIQACNFVGTTEKDFNIAFYGDSLIKVIIYTTSYRDQYNSVTRGVYSGTYYIVNDTLNVDFRSHSTEIKGKDKKISTFSPLTNV